MTIQVEGIDKFAPVFEKTTYTVDIDEDRLYDNLVQVKAIDNDKEGPNGDICSYEMLSTDAPFQVSSEGTFKLHLCNHSCLHHLLDCLVLECWLLVRGSLDQSPVKDRLLDSLVLECWLLVRGVPGSIHSQ